VLFRSAHNRTRFPLIGGHANLDCGACHRGAHPFEYANTTTDCGTCHAQTYDRTTSPNHKQVNFSRRCEECHSALARTWQGVDFQHPASFPLVGVHRTLPCASCHSRGYSGAQVECYTCHEADYKRTTNPNHVAGGFSTKCDSCHSGDAWHPAAFDHSRARFQLTGAHAKVTCDRCHPGGRYTGTPRDCYSCHSADYSGTTNPNHVAGGFARTCQDCHTTDAWKPATFDHNRSRFPLTGAHRNVTCDRCHPGGRYTGTPRDCYSCHAGDYNGTSNPNHAAAHFPTSCQDCHTTQAWKPAQFDHDGSYFPIYSGTHRGVWSTCGDCHVNPSDYHAFECILCHAHSDKARVDSAHQEVGGYRYQSSACYSCHPRGAAGGDLRRWRRRR
jgi:hypothetical protein